MYFCSSYNFCFHKYYSGILCISIKSDAIRTLCKKPCVEVKNNISTLKVINIEKNFVDYTDIRIICCSGLPNENYKKHLCT